MVQQKTLTDDWLLISALSSICTAALNWQGYGPLEYTECHIYASHADCITPLDKPHDLGILVRHNGFLSTSCFTHLSGHPCIYFPYMSFFRLSNYLTFYVLSCWFSEVSEGNVWNVSLLVILSGWISFCSSKRADFAGSLAFFFHMDAIPSPTHR